MYNLISIDKVEGILEIKYEFDNEYLIDNPLYDPLIPIEPEKIINPVNGIGTDLIILGPNYLSEFVIEIDDTATRAYAIDINYFEYEAIGITNTKFLKTSYRQSRNGSVWTDWHELNGGNVSDFPYIDPLDNLYIELKFEFVGDTGIIVLSNYSLLGKVKRDVYKSNITLLPNEVKILKPDFIYKIFEIENVEIVSAVDVSDLDIRYRFSQNNSRTWTEWEVFTVDNLITKKIDPIRFFQIEYRLENKGTNIVKLDDINIIGKFIDVNKQYEKTNLFGLRECCLSFQNGSYDSEGNFIENTNLNSDSIGGMGGDGDGDSDYCETIPPMTPEQEANLFNPYNQSTAIDLYNKLSTEANTMFGHKVCYYVSDPDENGIDYSMHEYTLYNILCKEIIKVSVNNNEFPDSQIKTNIFDLDLFDSMEVHIPKTEFKRAFGKHRRPSRKDIIEFCELNRAFTVTQAQAHRNFNNASVYYRLILKKYTQEASVRAVGTEVKNSLETLTMGTTLESLMGLDKQLDKASVANKQQHETLSTDTIRLEYNANIHSEDVYNSSMLLSKQHYDMSSIEPDEVAVMYRTFDNFIKPTDNIGYMVMFNINNILDDEYVNLFTYRNDNNIGIRIDFIQDGLNGQQLIVALNSDIYTFDLTGNELDEEVWYGLIFNLDNRNRTITSYIYKRNVIDEEDAPMLSSSKPKLVFEDSINIISPISMEIFDTTPRIFGSDSKMTNIRFFDETIPESVHNKLFNMYVIGNESKYLVFGDNATRKMELPRFPYNE